MSFFTSARALRAAMFLAIAAATRPVRAFADDEHKRLVCDAVAHLSEKLSTDVGRSQLIKDACATATDASACKTSVPNRLAVVDQLLAKDCDQLHLVGSMGGELAENAEALTFNLPSGDCTPVHGSTETTDLALSVAFSRMDYCPNAISAYREFHSSALTRAVNAAILADNHNDKAEVTLLAALRDEAEALHFYADLFAPGHVIGRPFLRFNDLYSPLTDPKVHDGANRGGMRLVSSEPDPKGTPRGDGKLYHTWLAYGDGKLYTEPRNADNLAQLTAGIDASLQSWLLSFVSANEVEGTEAERLAPGCPDDIVATRVAALVAPRPTFSVGIAAFATWNNRGTASDTGVTVSVSSEHWTLGILGGVSSFVAYAGSGRLRSFSYGPAVEYSPASSRNFLRFAATLVPLRLSALDLAAPQGSGKGHQGSWYDGSDLAIGMRLSFGHALPFEQRVGAVLVTRHMGPESPKVLFGGGVMATISSPVNF